MAFSNRGNYFELTGSKELSAAISELNNTLARKVLRPAIKEGLKIAQEYARQNAQPGSALSTEASGLMVKAIDISAKVKRNGDAQGKLFVNRKHEAVIDDKKHNPGNIASFVELGHGGKFPAAPHPFLRPAVDNHKPEIQAEIALEASVRLPKAVEEARRKGKKVYLYE